MLEKIENFVSNFFSKSSSGLKRITLPTLASNTTACQDASTTSQVTGDARMRSNVESKLTMPVTLVLNQSEQNFDFDFFY